MYPITMPLMIIENIANIFPDSMSTTLKINPIADIIITKLRDHFFLENKAPAIVA